MSLMTAHFNDATLKKELIEVIFKPKVRLISSLPVFLILKLAFTPSFKLSTGPIFLTSTLGPLVHSTEESLMVKFTVLLLLLHSYQA